jgi:hypothetical protein
MKITLLLLLQEKLRCCKIAGHSLSAKCGNSLEKFVVFRHLISLEI